MTTAVAKAELHCHLEGAASPDLVRRLAERHGIALPAGLFNANGAFAWHDFTSFLPPMTPPAAACAPVTTTAS